MARVEHHIDVELPLQSVYDQWTQFEDFPRFMEGVRRVTQIDDRHLHWEAEIGFVQREWDAEITMQVPDELIEWQAVGQFRNDGRVSFVPRGPHRTHLTLAIDYDPEGFAEQVGDRLGLIDERVAGDLRRFKQFLESRGSETGGWRGELR
jgi:uncharacterized membrane protein